MFTLLVYPHYTFVGKSVRSYQTTANGTAVATTEPDEVFTSEDPDVKNDWQSFDLETANEVDERMKSSCNENSVVNNKRNDIDSILLWRTFKTN